jgi:hypothetical protein
LEDQQGYLVPIRLYIWAYALDTGKKGWGIFNSYQYQVPFFGH